FPVGTGPASRSKCCRQTDDAGSVSSAVAAVNIVGSHHLPRKLLRRKVHLVRGFRAAEDPERLGSLLPRRIEPGGGPVQGLLPGRNPQRAVLTDHRLRQTPILSILSLHLPHLLSVRSFARGTPACVNIRLNTALGASVIGTKRSP